MNRSTDPLITDLLAGRLPDRPCDAIELRVSAQSAKELKDNVDAASPKLGFHPAVAYLKTLDLEALLLDKSATGEQFRRRIGLIPIRRANAHPYALEPNRLMGWALPLPAHATVILMLFDSAADPTVHNPDEPLPGNAVSALLSHVCRIDQIHRLYVAEWDRWVRAPHFGAAVRAAAQLGGVDIFEGAERIDITSTEGTMFAGMKDGHASGERNNIRKRTTRAVLTKLLADRIEWPYAKVLLFPGYDLAYDRQRGDNGKVHRTRYLQSATGQHADGWQAWAEVVADGGTFLAAGRELAAHQVPVRGTRHVNPDGSVKTYDQLTDEQLERASRTLAAHVRLLRTRKYEVNKGVPIPIRRDQDFEGFAVDHDDRGPKRYGGIHRIVDLPGHCIDLTDEQWDAWERRIHGRTPRDTRTDGPRAPFADVRQQWFVTATGERREAGDPDWTHNLRIVANGDSYELFRRTREQAHNDRGELRGWISREGEHLYSARRCDLDGAYARAGIARAVAHIGEFEPVVVDSRPLPDPVEQERLRTERLAELEDLIIAATDDVDDAELVHERARTTTSPPAPAPPSARHPLPPRPVPGLGRCSPSERPPTCRSAPPRCATGATTAWSRASSGRAGTTGACSTVLTSRRWSGATTPPTASAPPTTTGSRSPRSSSASASRSTTCARSSSTPAGWPPAAAAPAATRCCSRWPTSTRFPRSGATGTPPT
ncbi:hypothetical protein [Geodermatophilus sp. URMC 60]